MPIDASDLNEAEGRRLRELLAALRTPVSASINPDSWLVSETFAAEFQSRLLAQHVFMKSVVEQSSFDAAFIASSKIAGASVQVAIGGQRFWDVRVGDRTISLKSSSALNLREAKLHISKLTEAAWIQDCRTPKMRMERVHGLFLDYVETVSSIIQLRYFRRSTTYELVEIPTTLLRQVLELRVGDFLAEGTTVNIPVGKIPPDFTLKLDRSDAKITLANIAKEGCIVHGTWTIS